MFWSGIAMRYVAGSRRHGRKTLRKRDRTTVLRGIEHLEPRMLLTLSANFHPVVVDPVDRLAGSRVLGEWNGTTLDGWTSSQRAKLNCRQWQGDRRLAEWLRQSGAD